MHDVAASPPAATNNDMAVVQAAQPAASTRRAPYVRPQQGLRLRKSGGTMQVNLENIGGRILVLAERATHKKRMRAIKPVVNVQPPWGHGGGTDRRQRSSSRSGSAQSAGGGGGSGGPGNTLLRESPRPGTAGSS
eukprot:Rhum_TRINITY_DN25932_c0_g1::Rhum_TRINITY_DN25932_c0_g1_i1::g.182978::m.182978